MVHSSLDGVTTAIALFIFAALLFPNVIKNRTQYYVAFASLLFIILMSTLSMMFDSINFARFAAVVIGFLQFIAVTMLVLCAGGMTAQSLAGDLSRAYDVIRRGENEKETIVPLTGMKPRPKASSSAVKHDDDEEGRVVFDINSPQQTPPVTPPAVPPASPVDKTIPLED